MPAIILACLLMSVAVAADQPAMADLAGVANMGFLDPVAGDGVGGWSDQGPENGFDGFPVGRQELAGIPFRIVDPAANAGRAALSLRHHSLPGAPERALLPLPPGSRGRWLYLLHSSCWGGLPDGTVVGTVAVGGRSVEVRAGRDIADWWTPKARSNAALAVVRSNPSSTVGAYASRFDLGEEVAADAVAVATTGRALWIVVAATLSAQDLPLAADAAPERSPLTMAADAVWRPIDTADLAVKPGTALDLAGTAAVEPAGSHGRVIARRDGHFAFAEAPERAVRFTGAVMLPELELAGMSPEAIVALAEAVRVQGYNIVRPHFLDCMLTPEGVPEGQWFEPGRLDRWERLVAELKRRGIYLYLDAMTHWSGYAAGPAWTDAAKALDYKKRIWGDAEVRRQWRDPVRALLTHRNPYTGTTLAEDPQVAVILPFNEQEHNLFAWGVPDSILPGWRDFLRRRYGSMEALRRAWGREPRAAAFAELPLFTTSEVWDAGALGRDIAEYLMQGEAELVGWFTAELRGMGYQGLITHFDYLQSRRYVWARRDLDVVSMHGYHAHPGAYKDPGSRIVQTSALADGLGWWRGIQAMRIAGRPFMASEYQHVYWNRYRHEEGLAVGAYASLQDLDGLFQFSWPVLARGRAIWPFYAGADPVARASGVVTALLWSQRRLAAAPHRVDLAMTRDDVVAKPEAGVAGDQSRLGLLTGLTQAIAGAGTARPADLTVPLGAGARLAAERMVVATVDSGAGDLVALVARLRAAGILPPGNRTDPAAGRFESETGEILLDTRAQRLEVRAPGIAGAVVHPPLADVDLGAMRIAGLDAPAALVLADLAGRDLATSRRMLLVAATDARNSGEVYDDQDATVLRRIGGLPVLWRCCRFAVEVPRAPGAPSLAAWSLALDGSRRDPIPLAPIAGGLRLAVDTATLPSGPTPFVELAAE